MLTRIQKQTGETRTQSFKVAFPKPIIDEIDKVLVEHQGFTNENLTSSLTTTSNTAWAKNSKVRMRDKFYVTGKSLIVKKMYNSLKNSSFFM